MIKKIFPSLSSLGSDGNTAFLRAARAGHLDKVLDHLKNNVDINTSNTNGLNALHLASKDGHIDVVTELLKRGANVDSATKKGNTALHIASLAGQEDVVKLLVEHGASVNVQSQNGFTPLYMAAQENHDSVVKFLLTNNANQSLATEDGFTPLAVAMQQGHDKVVAVLLENDSRGKVRLPALHIAAKKDDCKAAALLLQNEHNPDVTSKSGFTPLHIASHYGNEGIAQLLLSKSADVNYSAKHNITPLHVAAKWGKANMVALLLDRGANIEAKTRDGLTPLHCAARSGHEQVVDMLLERGAPISSKTKNGLAPLHMASQGDHVDAARILLYHRAPVDDVTVDYLTALHVAAHCGHAAVARLLLDRKADPNARALNGFTPLHIACKKNRIKVVELLLKHGASIEATTESGLTPLHVASFMGCMNIVIYLVQNEASPDVTTVRGETPLHLAARANQTDIIRILLRNGAHVSARAREQQTPLHIASRLGNVDIVMLLLQHGANVDCTTKDLYTPLHIAAKEGQEEVASVLVENGASLEAQTKKGFTPLHLAAKYGNMKVAKLLLQKDAPVDAQGKNGVTSLHVASHYDHQNVALLLLEKGASPHATAKNGHTPLHIAARKNQMDIATTLLEYGAKAETESKAGFTPLHLSSQEGHTDMTTLLLDHHADPNHKAKNGLTPLHLCAQEDRVEVASILLKNQAEIDATTKAGYTPLHVASHFGQANMVRLLLAEGASVKNTTAVNYTPLHQAAQQGHAGIVTTLLQSGADPNQTTNQGQTALSIAQKLGYISVVESLKGVTEAPAPPPSNEDKYKVVAPETMQETFMSDSEDEGGEDTAMAEQPYHYLTVDEMKTLGDDSLPIDVTRDTEHHADNRDLSGPPVAIDEQPSPTHVKESYSQYTAMDNVEIAKHAQHIGFLVSFLVDARGGAMRGCRHSGVRVIVPPRRAPAPLRITCRYLKRDKMPHPPPLMEGEALASRILELAPVAAKFLAPIMIEVPHFASLRNKEREIVILRSDNGETWREHTFEASEEAIQEILSHSFDKEELSQLEESPRTSRILMTELPHYLAVVSRVKQEVHAIGPEGGMVSSTVVPQVQAVFPQGALTKKIKVGLQAQPIPMELTAKLLGNRVAVSPIVTVEPRRRKFHKPITLTIPVPQAASKGMINTYSGDAPTLRLLCSITGGTSRAQWEDVTGSTPLTFVNDCVSFTTTVSARFWLMDCRNIEDATKMATELYREAIHVPFMAKFVVFAKRTDMSEARLRVFCMTDDKEDKTLEHQEQFTEVAKSRDVEVLEGKTQYVEFAGNLVPITKSGDQLQLGFRAFKENRLPFTVKVKDPHADAIGRILFMREPKVAKGDAPQQPMCILNIVLPDNIIPEPLTPDHDGTRTTAVPEGVPSWQRLTEVSESLGDDWIRLAGGLDVSMSQVNRIKTEYCDSSPAQQGLLMLKQWVQDAGNKASGSTLEEALRKIGRYDIVERCLYNEDQIQVSTYGQKVEIINKQIYPSPLRDINRVEATVTKKQDTLDKDKDDKEEKKYSAEEKEVDELEMKKSVSERKREIERRISEEQDKKKEPSPPPPVTLRRSESKERKESQSLKKDDKDELSKSEKETCEEKSISPEPANLSFDEKRRSFELGRLIKEKPEKKADLTQKFIDSEKVVYQMTSEEPEQELSFQEKRLSFEKGLIKSIEEKPEILDSKIIKKIQMETIVSTETTTKPITEEKVIVETTKDAKFLEGVAKGLSDFKEKEILVSETQGIISPKLSTTPPPSPADVLKAKAGEIEWKSTPTSDIDGAPPKSPIQKADEPFKVQQCPILQPELSRESQFTSMEHPISQPKSIQGQIILTERLIDDDNIFENQFISESGSPSIFRRPHQATDFVIFDDEDWDTQDIVEFNDVTTQVLPGSCPYVPEKFLEDSSKGELHQEKVQVFEKPFEVTKCDGEMSNIDTPEHSRKIDHTPEFTQIISQSVSQPIIETTTTTYNTVQSNDPGEVTVTKVVTERRFQPLHGQTFTFNDFSNIPDSNFSDSMDDCELNFQKSEANLNADDSLKFIVDFAESCKTSTEDLGQSVDKSETENLVEIVDVTDDLCLTPLRSVTPDHKVAISDDKSDLIRRLDECMIDDIKPRPKADKKKISNIPSRKEGDFSISSGSETASQILSEVDAVHQPSSSSVNDYRNGRYLGSGGESISRLEDELSLLEKLEDQIKMLKEEEAKMKSIEVDLKRDVSDEENITEANILSDQMTTGTSVQSQKEEGYEAFPEQLNIGNEDIARVIEEAHNVLSANKIDLASSAPAEIREEQTEEKTKKKKNRKRRSKKAKEGDLEVEETPYLSQSSEEHQKQDRAGKSKQDATHSKNDTRGEFEGNSEREFQRMVSQLSVEEVNEAMQIWNKDFNPINPHIHSEREEEQSSSSDQKSKSKDDKK